jgi:hypothetical protein
MMDETPLSNVLEASNNNKEGIDKEQWIFSLSIPDSSPIEIVTTHDKFVDRTLSVLPRTTSTTNSSHVHRPPVAGDVKTTTNKSRQKTPTSEDHNNNKKINTDELEMTTMMTETKSLLDSYEYDDDNMNLIVDDGIHHQKDGSKTNHPIVATKNSSSKTPTKSPYAWMYFSPVYGMSIQSSTLLRLSYRPAWQGIPEYTKGKRQRALTRAVSCCCPSSSSSSSLSQDNASFDEQIWEIYTARQIVKTTQLMTSIRGMGECQSIQVFLKPLWNDLDGDGDHELYSGLKTPPQYQAALNLHQQRMGRQNHTWTRFEEPGDSQLGSSTVDNKDGDDGDERNNFIVLTFAVPVTTQANHDPPLLWKVDIPPKGPGGGMVLDTMTVLDGSIDLQEPATHVFIEGYQSWSFTGSVWKGQPQPKPAMLDVFSGAFNFGGCLPDPPTVTVPVTPRLDKTGNLRIQEFLQSTTKPESSATIKGTLSNNKPRKYPYKSDLFACVTTGRDEILDENGGPALICGWLSQHKQFGVVSIDEDLQHVTMHATHNAIVASNVTTDWAFAQLVSPHHYDEEPMVHYLHAAAAYNEAKPLQNGPLLTGWCSWYHYYENISEENLRANFSKLAAMKHKVPTNVTVVDDGYMTAWGDWDSLKPKKFTTMANVAKEIAKSKMRPGIWLAPFAADKHSKIAKLHPEWIIRNDRGAIANSSNCGKFFYGLDATNPQVRQHAFESIRRAVQDWGFQVLKIDFLYAACLDGNGKHDMSLTRAEAMHLALQTIREAAGPDVFLIGCGCPIGTAIGYVDGMRVSADTGPTWYPALPLPWWDNGTLPSLRAMIRNSLSRAPMGHRWWNNDPDCLLLGESTSLTNEEVASAASIIAMTCGMMLLSDDLTKVSLNRMKVLTQIFPMTGVSGVVLDLHTTKNQGMPSLLRLWCTDRHRQLESFRATPTFMRSLQEEDFNAEATHFGRQSAYNSEAFSASQERNRSCIHVAKGMGTWTVISLSNWSDKAEMMHVPSIAISSPSETGWGARDDILPDPSTHSDDDGGMGSGYHVYSFWSGRYSWLSNKARNGDDSNPHPITRRLLAHETEIFHIRKVTPGSAQYVGSDLHFSCGHEVLSFDDSKKNCVKIALKTELSRVGHIFLFIPIVDTSHVQTYVAGSPSRWSVIGNVPDEDGSPHCIGRIIRVMVVVHSDMSERDGEVEVKY